MCKFALCMALFVLFPNCKLFLSLPFLPMLLSLCCAAFRILNSPSMSTVKSSSQVLMFLCQYMSISGGFQLSSLHYHLLSIASVEQARGA
ncbi:MAG: hypothetical protein NXY57DRAFT_1004677 [Lentinula lateritia]|nr:MAG: hypothetical protein NXY57DRAFT_1004677 [Lentinula lateritia]